MDMFRPKWQRRRGDIASILHFKVKKCSGRAPRNNTHWESLQAWAKWHVHAFEKPLVYLRAEAGLIYSICWKAPKSRKLRGSLTYVFSVWGQWAMSQARRHSYDLSPAHSLPALWNSNIQVEEWQHLTTLCIVNRKRERGRNGGREQL